MAEHRRRRATPSGGGKPLAPFGLRAAHTRLLCCGSSMMLGHHRIRTRGACNTAYQSSATGCEEPLPLLLVFQFTQLAERFIHDDRDTVG